MVQKVGSSILLTRPKSIVMILFGSFFMYRYNNLMDKLAVSATLHCLTGCAIGEILGLIIGTILGFSTLGVIALAIGLAFLFGYSLSLIPLIKNNLSLWAAMKIVLAADTLSIATMEVVDNSVMAIIPGALHAGLVNPLFWSLCRLLSPPPFLLPIRSINTCCNAAKAMHFCISITTIVRRIHGYKITTYRHNQLHRRSPIGFNCHRHI